MERKIIETGDGSKTIQLVDWNEQYHSIHGALQEARHVFIEHFTRLVKGRVEVSVFEMGFGTGLNAFLTQQAAHKIGVKVHYFSLEAYPVKKDEYAQLDYPKLLNDEAGIWDQLMSASWETTVHFDDLFSIHKREQLIEDWRPSEMEFDFLFYDAFGPRVQPHLWTVEIFQKLYKATKPSGVFLTYCAKGQVRRDLVRVGFEMHRLPGPPGKREMLLGVK